ncbi:hypothetical protein ACHAO4_003344 [Trichoderma viride]
MTYATPATSVSQSSPESNPYSETYGVSVVYNTTAPYSDPTSYVDSATSSTSPESNSSSANYDAAVAHSATIATTAPGLYTHTEYSEDNAQQQHHF